MSSAPSRPNQHAGPAPWPVLILVLGTLLGIGFLASSVFTGDGTGRVAAIVFLLVRDGAFVLAWLAAAAGFGGLAVRLLAPECRHPVALRIPLGIGILLWLDHALGMAGALQWGSWIGAWALCGLGWMLLAVDIGPRLVRESKAQVSLPEIPWFIIFAVPAIAVMITASMSAPGYLWLSEAHGYDVLEYHLQLPREWLALGRIASVEHNVYSFAGSYVEAAYYHLAVLAHPFTSRPLDGALASATTAQLLHATFPMFTAALLYTLSVDVIGRRGASIAAGLYLALPWTVVTGSMAYNEQAVVLMLVAGLAVVGDTSLTPGRRALLVGLVSGIACGAKLTALGFVALPLAAVFLFHSPPRLWWKIVLLGAIGGVLAYGPVLVRNGIATNWDNPIFPLACSVLGSAHWTAEQVARWNASHMFDGSLPERVIRFLEMALQHPQWAGLFVFGAVSMMIIITRKRLRPALSDAILLLVIQLLFWISLTHLQSRFLIPCAVPLVFLIGAALSGKRSLESDRLHSWRNRLMRAWGGVLVLAIALWTVVIFAAQRHGAPSAMIDGLPIQTGLYLNRIANPSERASFLAQHPTAFLNLETDPEEGLYLLGDATPFYILRPVRYHTTYDTSPLGNAIRANPDDPAAWASTLLAADIWLVHVNYDELARLIEKDHWYDPNVTTEKVDRMLVANNAVRVMSWEVPAGRGRALYRLRPVE